ncbi:hypothetical protein KW801_01345, partial [Candidatus Saccharibacteria bacterium]|nr:hypothetical protein [Candidatus Saccharibacteria bacterium]
CERIRPNKPREVVQDATIELESGTEMDLSGTGRVELAHLKSRGEILGSIALFEGSLELQPSGLSLSGGLVKTKGNFVTERLLVPETWELMVVPDQP